MTRIYYFILLLGAILHLSSYGQVDSLYHVFNKETSLFKMYSRNDKFFIFGKYSESYQNDFPFFGEINKNLKLFNPKKLNIDQNYDQFVFSENSIDSSYFFVGMNFTGNKSRTLYKFDHNGVQVFRTELSTDSFFYAISIIQTLDRGYLLTGYNHFDGKESAFLAKISTDGTKKWYKQFISDGSTKITGTSIVEKNNAYYLLAGKEIRVNGPPYYYNSTLIYKMSLSGDSIKLWKELDSNSYAFESLLVDKDENILYTYRKIDSFVVDTATRRFYYLQKPAIALRDKNNAIKWNISLQKNSEKWSGIFKMKELKDGNYLGVGEEYNAYGTDSSITAYAIKFSKQGQIIWQKNYRKSFLHPTNQDWFVDFHELNDNSIILMGNSYQYFAKDTVFIPNGNQFYGWTIRVNAKGEILDGAESSVVSKNSTSGISAYPNPFSNTINIQHNDIKNESHISLTMMNNQGKIVQFFSREDISILGNREYVISPSKTLSPGIYYIKIASGNSEEWIRITKVE